MISRLRQIAILIIMFSLTGCDPFPSEKEFVAKKFNAETVVDGYEIGVEMVTSHPFLSEHKKLLKIQRNGNVIFTGEFYDTGGFSRFFVLRKEEKIYIVDGLGNGVAIDTKNKYVSEDISSRDVDPEWNEPNIGVFQFVEKPSYSYSWIPHGALVQSTSNSTLHIDTKRRQ